MIENPNVICNDCAYCKENKQLRERLEKTQELELEVRRESTKLKELLKECRSLLSFLQINDYDNNGLLVIGRINQALGEDK